MDAVVREARQPRHQVHQGEVPPPRAQARRAGPPSAGHARSACIVLREGKGGDPKECIKGEGAIKDYYSKHPTEKVPGEDQSFLDANRE